MDLSAKILETINKREKKEHRNYIGCSSIGNPCSRAIWYSFHNAPSLDYTATTQTTFDVGKNLEGMILDYIEEAGISLIRPCQENNWLYCFDKTNPKFQGHMDAIIYYPDYKSPAVLEIKTAKSSRFQSFQKKGLKEFSLTYYAQIQAYIGMMGYEKGVLLALNKDTSELHHEWVDFDPYCYAELQRKAEIIESSEEPPDRINKSPFYYICTRCNYRDTCFFGEKK